MALETLERITQLAISHSDSHWTRDAKALKFRVTFRLTLRGMNAAHEESFCYYDLVTAKRAYRDMLLGLYRGRDVVGFAICLNRVGDGAWERGILREGDFS